LVDLRKSDLKVSSVGKISISGDGAGNTATEVSLSRESLLNRLHGKVSVASVRDLPESDLRSSGKENILGTISDKLHQSSSHFSSILYKKKKISEKN